MKIKENIDRNAFREYDVRGEYPTQIDEDLAYTLGLAFGTTIKRNGKHMCVVGHDNRLSGESLSHALVKGIMSTGIDVKYLGLVTTPMYYFACLYLKVDSGIMVTASHNPVNDNGFKITLDDYFCAVGKDIQDLYELCMSRDFESGIGGIEDVYIDDKYRDKVINNVEIKKRLKVVVDPANAAGTVIVKDIFDNLNVDPIYINIESDGSFPNHHPDPSVPENMKMLSEKVIEVGADCGIALDGDADRVGLVDDEGKIINIDTFMAIICDDLIPKLDNKTILFDVKCSKQLEDEIIKLGGNPYLYRTGASYLRNEIRKLDLSFGGELAGHIFFRDKWDGFDDGIYAGVRFLEVLSNTDKRACELDDNMTKYFSTPEIKIATTDDKKREIVEKVKEYALSKNYKVCDIDGARVMFDDGWALVRCSNTGPNLTTRFEAVNEQRCNKIKDEFISVINANN